MVLFFFSILVDLNNGTVYNEGAVVGQGLQALFVVTIAELRVKIFINCALFVVENLFFFIHFINILEIFLPIVIFVAIILEVAQNFTHVIHDNIDSIRNHLLLQPRIVLCFSFYGG